MIEELRVIGKNLPRKDAMKKATGVAQYTADIRLPGMLHGKCLRSPYAHANILSIDTSKAEALPGVKAMVTYKDVAPRNAFRQFNAIGIKASLPTTSDKVLKTLNKSE